MSTLHRKRALAHGANSAVLTVAAIGSLVVGYILVDKFRPFRKDLTQAGLYSLAPRTTEILSKLDRDVAVTYFSLPPSAAQNAQAINLQVQDLLTEYKTRSKGHVAFTLANPLTDAERVEELGGDLGAAVFQSGEKKIVVQNKELVKEEPESGEMRFNGEEAFDSALLRLVEGKTRTACFLTGHGEPAIDGEAQGSFSLAKELLRRENLESKLVTLGAASTPGGEGVTLGKKVSLDKPAANTASAAVVPPECNVLIVAGPQAPIGGDEANAIVKFWDEGGGVMLLAEPFTKSGIEMLAARFGIEILPGVAADPQRKVRSPLAILPAFGQHEIVDPLTAVQTPVLFAKAVGLKIAQTMPAGATATRLLETSAAGLELVDIKNGEADPESKKNIAGPILLGAAVEKKVGEKSARAVIFGDSDFAANAAMQAMAMSGAPGNVDLFKNAVAWTTGAAEKIGIGPKSSDHHPVTISDRNALMVLAATSLGMPALIFAGGISVWARRRRK